MKETPGSLRAYFYLVGAIIIVTGLVFFIDFAKAEDLFDVVFILLIGIISLVIGIFFAYFGINMEESLLNSPGKLRAFITIVMVINFLIGFLSGQLTRLIGTLLIGLYLIHNINRLSKELKAKEIKSKAVKEAKEYIISVEKKYYEDKWVKITNSQAIIMGKTYSMTNIISADMEIKSPNSNVAISFAVIGILLMLCSGFSVGVELYDSNDFKNTLIGVIVIGLILVIIGFWIGFTSKKSFCLKIGIALEEKIVMKSKNKEYIQEIVDSINQAITERGE